MDTKFSIKIKLILLVLFLIAIAAANGGLGLYGMKNAVDGLNTVYNDRVVPLRDLKEIADAYAVNIVDTNHKVRNGNLSTAEGVASVEHAEKLIREKWQAYLATFLVDEEKQLVAEIKPLMKNSDAAATRLKQLFAAGDMDGIATFSAQELYPAIDPISDAFSKLIQVQLDVAKREFDASEAQYGSLKFMVIALMLLGSLLALVVSIVLINRSVIRPLSAAGDAVTAIAQGDLSRQLPPAGSDEIGAIIGRLIQMQTSLRQLISGIGNSVAVVNNSANQLAESTTVSARIGEEQSTQASGIAAGVEQLSVSIDLVSEHTREAKSITTASGKQLDENGRTIHDAATGIGSIADAVNAAAATINELEALSDQISSIVSVIREIADQTNLLALNAAIEAARAGEQGRGFAVVADEVRKLAERTTSSTQQVATMIGKIQAGAKRAVAEMDSGVASVDQGVILAQKAGASVNSIRESGIQVSNAVDSISAAIQEQAAATRDIARKVEFIAEGAERNSAAVAQSASMAKQLENQAQELGRMASHFRV